jgi:hypothetical protein
MRILKIILVFLTAWVIGLAAYLGALALIYRQSISAGDFSAVLIWSLLAFVIAFCVLYLPALFGLRWWLRGVRPLWPFPLLAVLLGIVPTALIVFLWSGGLRSLLSPESSLFYAMFATVGVVVGVGFALIYRHDHAT